MFRAGTKLSVDWRKVPYVTQYGESFMCVFFSLRNNNNNKKKQVLTGSVPDENDRFITRSNGGAMEDAAARKTVGEIPSGPGAL